MATRRGFLGRLLATLPALPLLPRLASARVPRRVSAAPGIPRQMDIRHAMHPLAMDLQPYRYGEKILNAVAYDLDADTLTVLGDVRHDGVKFAHIGYCTLSGGVAVQWVDGPR